MKPLRWEDIPREKLNLGLERQVIWGERATLARFYLANGTHIARHSHESEQHTFVLEGALKMNIAGEDILLLPGNLLTIPSGAEHEAWALDDTVVLDFFAPVREDWRAGQQQYLQGK